MISDGKFNDMPWVRNVVNKINTSVNILPENIFDSNLKCLWIYLFFISCVTGGNSDLLR